MPTNKHAIIRYRTIDRCLRKINQQWTWRELVEECEKEIFRSTGKEVTVSERTIKYDIAAMRSDKGLGYYAPIEYDRKEKSYYYSDLSYKLTESPINQTDQEILQNAISLLGQFTEVAEVTGIQSILTKLESRLDLKKERFEPVIQFDQQHEASGQNWLNQLYQSIKKRKPLNILYQAFDKKAASRIISPQLLKEYSGRWYLLAFDHRRKETRVFGLDRIKEIKESLAAYHPIENRIAKKYFDQVVGVSVLKERKAQKVRFEAYGNQMHYFNTKPLHSSQRLISQTKKKAVFEIEVIVNYELKSELLSFQDSIKVLSPKSLQQEFVQILDAMKSNYSG